jgi:hypothetical protein
MPSEANQGGYAPLTTVRGDISRAEEELADTVTLDELLIRNKEATYSPHLSRRERHTSCSGGRRGAEGLPEHVSNEAR